MNSPCSPWMFANNNDIREALEKTLPEIVTRKQACELTGGFFHPKTLANKDALGIGPRKKIKIGRQAGYNKQDFIDFFMQQIK